MILYRIHSIDGEGSLKDVENRKLIVLDRDGVINQNSDVHIRSPEQWVAIPGSLEAIARLCRQGLSDCDCNQPVRNLARIFFGQYPEPDPSENAG